jgi:hypothetical protein
MKSGMYIFLLLLTASINALADNHTVAVPNLYTAEKTDGPQEQLEKGLQANDQWEKYERQFNILILSRQTPKKAYTLFNLSNQTMIPVTYNDGQDKILDVKTIRDKYVFAVKIKIAESVSSEKNEFWGVIDAQGEWLVNPTFYSIPDIVENYAVGYTHKGIEIMNFQDTSIRAFPRSSGCRFITLRQQIVFSCENTAQIIRFDAQANNTPFLDINLGGYLTSTSPDGRFFLLNQNGRDSIYSDQVKKIMDVSSQASVSFLTPNLWVYTGYPDYTYRLFHSEKGFLDITDISSVSNFENLCIKVVFKKVDSAAKVLDSQGNEFSSEAAATIACKQTSSDSQQTALERTRSEPLKMLIVKNDDDLCGYQHQTGNWLIKPEFEYCGDFVDQVALVKQQGAYALINQLGQWLTKKPESRSIITREWELRYNDSGRDLGVIDRAGQWVIPPMLKEAETFLAKDGVYSCHFLSVPGCNKLSFNGEVVRVERAEVQNANPNNRPTQSIAFVQETALPVAINNEWGYQLTAGDWLIKPKYAEAKPFNQGFALVATNKSPNELIWGFIDAQGHEVVAPQFQALQNFFQGVAWFQRDNRWGLINQEGIELLHPQFKRVEPFESDFTLASEESSRLLVSTKGEIIRSTSPVPEKIFPFMDKDYALAIVDKYGDAHWGYLNRKGEWLNEPIYKYAGEFVGDYALVRAREYNVARGSRRLFWEIPEQEKSAYIINRVENFAPYPVLAINIIKDNRNYMLLMNTNGEWIATP